MNLKIKYGNVEIPFGAKDSELQEATYYIPKGFHAEIEGNNVIIKKGEQKPAWSEEDINMFGSILSTLGICANNPQIPADVRSIHKKEESWFNELYHRVQPKQEWSEEDEKYLKLAIDNFQMLGNSFLTAWLKSLKDRYTWKPSDEQITWLYRAADDASKDSRMKQVLNNLLLDLKKLKEE